MKKLGLFSFLLLGFAFCFPANASEVCNEAYQFCLKKSADAKVCETEKKACEANQKKINEASDTKPTATNSWSRSRDRGETPVELQQKSSEKPTEQTSKKEATKSTNETKKTTRAFNSQFDPDKIFPSWDKTSNRVKGVIGRNRRDGNENGEITLDQGDTKILIYFIPKLISILFKVVAPIVVIMFIYSGVQFIYAGDDEELLKKSKSFFQYALMGVVFIIFTYSAMKSIYYILSENTPQQDTQALYQIPKEQDLFLSSSKV